jgi:segregation and condensation protein B
MSLKAKLEAVIYAAEEPVTLAQLAVLFAADVLEWKAQQEADGAALPSAQPFLGEEFAPQDVQVEFIPKPNLALLAEIDAEFNAAHSSAESVQNSDSVVIPDADSEVSSDAVAETLAGANEGLEPLSEAPTADEPALPTDLTAEAELEQKRQARQLDREVRLILRQILDELIDDCISDDRGVEIREIAGGFRMATKPECHDAVRLFIRSLKPALKLSLPALETLAIIAYKQPVTAPEVNEIRGVESSGVFGSLLARKLIATAGRKPVIGRPILYKTTKEFLLRFGLKDVSELPSMEEFEKLAELELDEPEPDENSDEKVNPALGAEFDESASEELEDSLLGLGTEGSNQTLQTQLESPVTPGTAETAGRNEATTPAEAAPAAPPVTEQAEIESSTHDHPQESRQEGSQENHRD